MKIPEKTIREILSKFDFESVHQHMTEKRWTWALSKGLAVRAVPALSDLKEAAGHLLRRLELPNTPDCATGGFMALIVEVKGRYVASLHFVLEDYVVAFEP